MSRLALLILITLSAYFPKTKAQNTHPTFLLPDDGTAALFDPALWPFYHGVASGDPLPDAVILWTRVTPHSPKIGGNGATENIEVAWEMALDESFAHIEASGSAQTSAKKDFTVKVDVGGLLPNTHYCYRFKAFGETSIVGRTKTAAKTYRPNENPAPFFTKNQNKPTNGLQQPQLRLAVVSCNNYEAGYFNGFARIAEIPDLDAVVHLGDYIYEYGPGEYGDTSLHRSHLPAKEITTLQDYRTRYAQYRLDPDLRAAHQMHPFICVWDDHEIANNAYAEGAENHQPEKEGGFALRKNAATQAYYKWLPVREGKTVYRQFSFGGLADLFMLDERVAGRSAPETSRHRAKHDETRTMLGKEQLEWLKKGMKNSQATWKIIGNQVLFAELNVLPVFPKIFFNYDAWDGYAPERQAIKDFLFENDLRNTLFITGDTHSSWSFDIPRDFKKYKRKRSRNIVAHEFATPSVTSANFDEYKGPKTVRWMAKMFSKKSVNPHLRFLDLTHHGYLLLTLTPTEAVGEWHFVDTILERRAGEFVGGKEVVKAVSVPVLAGGNMSAGSAGK
ncbi:MAG: alkaline phosphatase D family protein [Lewinellaceae bacterium]|nr:alkaline phosphatase D family protein [Saprospiraceae bacterium]MCB9340006.1 alkaline phosphatase D family protein [Lewinellaceae bacterium]